MYKPTRYRTTTGGEFPVRVTRINKLSFWLQLVKPDGSVEKVIKVKRGSSKLIYTDEKGGVTNGATLFSKKSTGRVERADQPVH